MDLRSRFRNKRIAVFGDIMLDQYWWGTVDRISPEAPVPVVRMTRESVVPGGAANVAMNVAGLGATPVLLGCVGNDPSAALLKDNLASFSISCGSLLTVGSRPTALKTRVVAHGQHVVRIDRETIDQIDEKTEKMLINCLDEVISGVEMVIISDYAKGTVTPAIVSFTIDRARSQNIDVIVDPKGKDYSKYRGASILTPNRREAAEACALDDHLPNVVELAGRRLMDELELRGIVITEGERGMTLFERGREPRTFAAEAHETFDVTGAGDTVIATLGVGIAAGLSLVESVKLANTAASLVVEQVGTTAVSVQRLEEKLETLSMNEPGSLRVTQ